LISFFDRLKLLPKVQAIGIEPPLELQHYERLKAEKKAFFMDPALELVSVRGC
jgi:hypothetical protein